jgi:hypothetical protein
MKSKPTGEATEGGKGRMREREGRGYGEESEARTLKAL